MERQITCSVRLDSMERRTIREKGFPNVSVAFEGDELATRMRNLNHVSEGFAEQQHFEKAADTLRQVGEALAERTNPAWWRSMLHHEPGRAHELRQRSDGGVTLVLNPEQFSRDMAENAQAQVRGTLEALTIIEEALEQFTGVMA